MTIALVLLSLALFTLAAMLFFAAIVIKTVAHGVRQEWPTVKKFMDENSP